MAASDEPRHNRDFALQKYLLLHEQHESLRQHLDELRPETSTTHTESTSTTPTTSPVSSPTRATARPTHMHKRTDSRRASMPQYQAPRPRLRSSGRGGAHSGIAAAAAAASPMDLETIRDEATLAEVASEEAKLFDVNEGIKRALTELLNCQAVRGDQAFRTWVQCRLMETEQELRHGRRRRSCPTGI